MEDEIWWNVKLQTVDSIPFEAHRFFEASNKVIGYAYLHRP